jgi:hypothetical protein
MSKDWNFHCKTCDSEPVDFPGFNHGQDILRDIYKVRQHIYAIQLLNSVYISVEIVMTNYSADIWEFLHKHEGHEIELKSEYGDTEPIETEDQPIPGD